MTTDAAGEVAVGLHAVIAAYAQALDAGRTEDLVALFTQDGIAEITGMGTSRGHDAIRAAYAALVPAQPQLHLVTNTVITSCSLDEATAVSDFGFFQRAEAGWTSPVTGRYDDVFRKDADGQWRILSRTTSFML